MVEKIRLDGVTYAYGKTPVLQELSLGLQPSKFYGVVGPNGAGKSTLLKLMDGYLDPQQGVITLNDRPLQSYSLRELAQEVALIPQHSTIFPLPWRKWSCSDVHPFTPGWDNPAPRTCSWPKRPCR